MPRLSRKERITKMLEEVKKLQEEEDRAEQKRLQQKYEQLGRRLTAAKLIDWFLEIPKVEFEKLGTMPEIEDRLMVLKELRESQRQTEQADKADSEQPDSASDSPATDAPI